MCLERKAKLRHDSPVRSIRAGIGASRPLPRVAATVCFLITERALSLGGRNWSSCPIPAIGSPSTRTLGRVAFGHSAVERRCHHHSARVLFQRVHCKALSFTQINSPACRRSRLSSPLQTEEIQENLSLYMRMFGKYLAISGNIECHFPLSDRRLRRANRRTI